MGNVKRMHSERRRRGLTGNSRRGLVENSLMHKSRTERFGALMNVHNPNFKFKFQNKTSIRVSNIVENGTKPPLDLQKQDIRGQILLV